MSKRRAVCAILELFKPIFVVVSGAIEVLMAVCRNRDFVQLDLDFLRAAKGAGWNGGEGEVVLCCVVLRCVGLGVIAVAVECAGNQLQQLERKTCNCSAQPQRNITSRDFWCHRQHPL